MVLVSQTAFLVAMLCCMFLEAEKGWERYISYGSFTYYIAIFPQIALSRVWTQSHQFALVRGEIVPYMHAIPSCHAWMYILYLQTLSRRAAGGPARREKESVHPARISIDNLVVNSSIPAFQGLTCFRRMYMCPGRQVRGRQVARLGVIDKYW